MDYWSPEERAAYARQIGQAIKSINRLEGQALGEVRGMLEDLRGQVVERLVWAQSSPLRSLPPQVGEGQGGGIGSTYDLARLGQISDDISRIMIELRTRFPEMAQGQAFQMANLSAELIDTPVQFLLGGDSGLSAFGLSRSIASASALIQANLITRVSQETVRKISNEIALAATGIKSPFEVMQAVGKNLDDPSIFGSIARRAEVIVMTELGRVQSVATQARQEESAAVAPGIKKQWMHGAVRRQSRAAHYLEWPAGAHLQIVDVHASFAVGGEYLRFPRDPAGSAENTINCRCQSVPYVEGLQESREYVEMVQRAYPG